MLKRIEPKLSEAGDGDDDVSENVEVASSADLSGPFPNNNSSSNGSSEKAERSSLRSSTSLTQNSSTEGSRRAARRNAPLQARTSNPQSKSAASIIKELNQLKFSQDLYGRDKELQVLHDAYRRLGTCTTRGKEQRKNHPKQTSHNNNNTKEQQQQPMNLILLEGLSGTGKSALVKEFKRQIIKSSATSLAIFASGKFDQLLHQTHTAKPYSAFTSAFEELCGQFCARYDAHDSTDDNPLREALLSRDYVRVLVDLIPNLISELNLLDHGETTNKTSCADDTISKASSMLVDSREFDILKSQRRFLYAVRTFLRTTCTPEHPTILFLDDLQWADQPSLDLLEFILMEPDLQETILIIGSYRSNEVDDGHSLSRHVKAIEHNRERRAERIQLPNLTLEHVNHFIADLFNSTMEETLALAEIAHKKVQGNAFFLIQFLTALRDGGYIEYNIGAMKWTWELNNIRKSIVVSNNVLAYLMQRMSSLPESMQRIVLILSCLGSSFDQQVVTLLADGLKGSELLPSGSDHSAEELMTQLEGEGLLESFETKDGRRSFCFAHDQIELAAHSLQDDETTHLLKLQMAKLLYEKKEQVDFSGNMFLIVDLWNESREELSDEGDNHQLIELNQMAGVRALDLSAFNAAIFYFRSAISLIPMDQQWKDKYYPLCLELYNCLIKAEFSAGSWEHLSNDIITVLKGQDRPLLDKIVAYTAQITVLSSHENMHNEAISLAVEVLEKLGMKFRPGLGKLAILGALIKTKRLLKKHPLESLMSQTPMEDERKEVAMDILASVTSSLYAANPELYMTSVLKILRWSLKYGTTKHTSRCIGMYGLVEMALGNLQGGTAASKLSLQLAEGQGVLKSEYAPITSVYGFVYPWTHPLPVCQRKLYDGYKIGLQTGDMEYAMMNIALYGFFCYSNGKPLLDLEADMRDYAEQMEECNMMLQLKFLSLTWQTMLNLLGRSDNPLVLTGEAMNHEEVLADAEKENNPPLKAQLFCHQLQLAVYFCDFDLASSVLRYTSCIATVNPANPIIWRTALFEGLTAFEMVQKGNNKYKKLARKTATRMKGWVDQGNPNCVHLLYLLQAEQSYCDGSVREARILFDKCIATAARNGFRSDRALASERCALMYCRMHDDFWANEYYRRAYEVYLELEAFAKVEQLRNDHSFLRPTVDLSTLGSDKQHVRRQPFDNSSRTDDLPVTVLTVRTETSNAADESDGQERKSSFKYHNSPRRGHQVKSLEWDLSESSLSLSMGKP